MTRERNERLCSAAMAALVLVATMICYATDQGVVPASPAGMGAAFAVPSRWHLQVVTNHISMVVTNPPYYACSSEESNGWMNSWGKGTVEVDYPQISNHPNRAVQNKINVMLRTSTGSDGLRGIYELRQTFAVAHSDRSLLSVQFENYGHPVEALHGTSSRYAINVDVRTGERLALWDVIRADASNSLVALLNHMREDKRTVTAGDLQCEEGFYPMPDELVLVFSQGALGSEAEGPVDIGVPWPKIQPMLTPRGRECFDGFPHALSRRGAAGVTGISTNRLAPGVAEESNAEKQPWQAQINPGTETDPIALNIAFGKQTIPNRDIIESLTDAYEIASYFFDGLTPQTTNDGIFRVDVKNGYWAPPDMDGVGPFYLVKMQTSYYGLTEHNFARLFAPINSKEQVIPYLQAYERLFGSPFAQIVTSTMQKDLSEKGRNPPRVTEVTELSSGFRVRLVTYTRVHIEAFMEKTVYLGRDGRVKEEKPASVIKEYGKGIYF